MIRATATGVEIDLLIAPRASRDAVVGEHDGRLKIALTAPPVDGEANAALIRFLARQTGLPKAAIRLVRGATGRRKTVALDGIDPQAAQTRLHLLVSA